MIHCNQKTCTAVGFFTLKQRLDEVLTMKHTSEQVMSIPDMWINAVVASGIVERALASEASTSQNDVRQILQDITSIYCATPSGKQGLSSCIYKRLIDTELVADENLRRACSDQR